MITLLTLSVYLFLLHFTLMSRFTRIYELYLSLRFPVVVFVQQVMNYVL